MRVGVLIWSRHKTDANQILLYISLKEEVGCGGKYSELFATFDLSSNTLGDTIDLIA